MTQDQPMPCLRCKAHEYQVIVAHNPWLVCHDCAGLMDTLVMCPRPTEEDFDYVSS